MHVHFGIVLDHLDRMTDSTGLIQLRSVQKLDWCCNAIS